jgi:DNA (cytosine-5)-methyltransferase 1
LSFTVISTFSGCGGSSLGYKLAGGKVLLAVECDDNAVETYRLNFPTTPIFHGDIATLSSREVLERTALKRGELDILDGSPPCQGFSTAGRRNMADDRNQLFREYVRLLKELQPKCFVMENVSGMLKGKMKLMFVEILTELKACGYRVRVAILNAAHFDVPQSRERAIFIGVRNDIGIEPTHPIGRKRLITLRDALKGCPKDEETPLVGRSLRYYEYMRPGENGSRVCEKFTGKGNAFNTVRLSWDKICPTIPKTFSPNIAGFSHPNEARMLTTAELKRCATFPDDFKFAGTVKDAWNRIGNCVPPYLMRAIASHIEQTVLKRIHGENEQHTRPEAAHLD